MTDRRGRLIWSVCRLWLERSLPVPLAMEVVGDLEEEFRDVARHRGPIGRTVWLVGEALSVLRAARGARRCAHRVREEHTFMDATSLIQHTRHAVRSLRRTPGFTIAAVLTLAVGIGSTAAVGTVVNQALLEPLPFKNSARLAVIAETRRDNELSVSYLNFLDWRIRARSFDSVSACVGTSYTFADGRSPERIRGLFAEAALFHVLGAEPALGRVFTADEDRAGGARVVVIGDGLWRRAFGASPDAVGRPIRLDGQPYTIVGIMPPGFDFPGGIVYPAADVYVPFAQFVAANREDLANRGSHPGLVALGLLAPGITLASARLELQHIAADLSREWPATNKDGGVIVRDAITALVGDLGNELMVVSIAATLVLVIACANVGGLMLTRFAARRSELAVRVALGASRRQIIAGLAIESAVLAFAGGVAGVFLGWFVLDTLSSTLAGLPRLDTLSINARVWWFSLGVTGLSAFFCGVVPAWWTSRRSLSQSLRQRGGSSDSRGRRVLVSAQVGLATVLLMCAGLLSATLLELRRERGGIVPDGALVVSLRLDAGATSAQSLDFFDRLDARLRSLPGVQHVGAISTLPFSGAGTQSRIGLPGAAADAAIRTDVNIVTPDYFTAMGVTVVRGRAFASTDVVGAPPVAIVDERFAERFWPGDDPIGKHVQGWGVPDFEIVGVVRHVKNYGVGAVSREELYVPFAQRPRAWMYVIARTAGDLDALTPLVRQVAAEIAPHVPIMSIKPMRAVVDATIAGPRLATALSGSFAVAAISLALVGLTGLVTYLVDLKRREIGIRMALGATSGAIVAQVIGGALRLTAVGVAIGLVAAAFAARALSAELFGVSALDPRVYAGVAAAMFAAALLASWLPARRAARVPLSIVLTE